jgi:hypothetical protein
MGNISSYVVNNEGVVLNFQGKKIKDAPKFFVDDKQLPKGVIRDITEVSKFPYILRYMNDILNLMFEMKNEKISLTEKNKGGTYPSSSFTITTNFEKVWEYKRKEQVTKRVFTIKKSSQFLIKCLSEAGKGSTYFNIDNVDKVKDTENAHKISEKEIEKAGGYEKALFSTLNNDRALNECVKFPKGWRWIIYSPFKIVLKEEELKLSDNHKIRYVSFVTKFIENASNLSSTYEVSSKERKELILKYELFLFEILEEYFNIENVEI